MNIRENIIEILKKELIGTTIRYCSSDKNIIQESLVIVKNNGVTDKQFNSSNKKYQILINKSKVIGRHQKFDESKVKNIRFSTDSQRDEPVLILELESNHN